VLNCCRKPAGCWWTRSSRRFLFVRRTEILIKVSLRKLKPILIEPDEGGSTELEPVLTDLGKSEPLQNWS
jgi:hypothetical protein